MERLFARLRGCFKPFTVGEVLADFEQKAKQLLHVHKQRNCVAAANAELITKLSDQNSEHLAEAKKALDVEAKLRSLLS